MNFVTIQYFQSIIFVGQLLSYKCGSCPNVILPDSKEKNPSSEAKNVQKVKKLLATGLYPGQMNPANKLLFPYNLF